MITQLDSDLQGFATQRLGFHIGDYNIMGLTTKASRNYYYTATGGLFTKGNGGVLGYFDPVDKTTHIAPSLVYEMYDSREAQWNLLAVLTHELLHGVHHYLNGSHYDSEYQKLQPIKLLLTFIQKEDFLIKLMVFTIRISP